MMIVEEDPEEIAQIVNLFYRVAGSAERCSTSAIGALRQDLPVDTPFDVPLVEDLCNRITRAARGEWRKTTHGEFQHPCAARSLSQSN